MEFENLLKLAVNYGLGIILSVGMAIFLAWLLKYVLKQNERREERMADIIGKDLANIAKSVSDHDDRTNTSIRNFEEVHRRQRIEHEEFKKYLEKLELENDRRREAQIKIIEFMAEITKNLKELSEKDIFYQNRKIKNG